MCDRRRSSTSASHRWVRGYFRPSVPSLAGANLFDTLLGDQVGVGATLLSGVISSPLNPVDEQKGDLAFLLQQTELAQTSDLVQIKPLVGPVNNVRIGGKAVPFVAAGVSVTGVGLTPAVTFDAPTIGTPTDFSVIVYRATMSSGGGTTIAGQPPYFSPGTA